MENKRLMKRRGGSKRGLEGGWMVREEGEVGQRERQVLSGERREKARMNDI